MENHTTPAHWMRNFFLIWTGQAFSLLGSMLVQFALVWWLTQETHSATVLATATLAAVLPQVLFGPFAGALVDRWNRRLVMMLADTGIALATVGLAVLFWTGTIQVWHVYILMALRSIGGSLHWPAMQASTSLMVPHKHLSRIAGLNQSLQGGMNIVAPPLGALLISLIPIPWVLAIDVLTAALAVFPLFFVSIPQQKEISSETASPLVVLRDVRDGLKYVIAWPGLLAICIMATLLNFLMAPAGTLQPLLVTEHFHGTAWHLGFMESGWGLGVVAGGLVLTAWGGFKKKVYTSLAGIIGLSASVLLVGLTPGNLFGLAVAGMSVMGFMNPITNGPLFALLQTRVAPEMQGRVFMLVNSFAAAAMPVSMLIAGPLADWLGVRSWYLIGAVGCLAIGLAAFFIPAIIHIEDETRSPQPKTAP